MESPFFRLWTPPNRWIGSNTSKSAFFASTLNLGPDRWRFRTWGRRCPVTDLFVTYPTTRTKTQLSTTVSRRLELRTQWRTQTQVWCPRRLYSSSYFGRSAVVGRTGKRRQTVRPVYDRNVGHRMTRHQNETIRRDLSIQVLRFVTVRTSGKMRTCKSVCFPVLSL